MPTSWGSLVSFPLSCGFQVDRGLLEALASLLGPDPLLLFHWGSGSHVPTMEEYAELLQLDRAFQRDSGHTHSGSSVQPMLGECLSRRSLLETSLRARRGGRNSESMPSRSPFAGDRERGFRCSAHSFFSSGSAVTCGTSTASRLLITLRGIRATIPALLFVSLGGVQYPPRLGDLDAVTFDYIPSEDMWRLLSRVEVIWGRPTVRPGAHHIPLVSRSLRVSASTGQSEREASAARVESLRSTLHHNSVAVANVRRDLVAQRGNVSTLRTMNEFIREQLEISEDAKEQLEENLAEAREQLETEQAERTRVQDELDSLRSYTQALVDPATGRPQDIVALRRALDASEEALTSARTSMGVMRVQISVLQGDNGVLQSELDLWCMMLLSPMLLGSIRRVSLWSLLSTRLTR
uniref:Uncharacterized protein n=1 Tax=Fagus sylvatica TaxID=28930 RepID=A0A2N9ERG9_FAGSY